jgi:phosphotransferase system enzyme I (PtsI)
MKLEVNMLRGQTLKGIAASQGIAHKAGKWVGMCGELAGMQKAIPILLGLGLDEFSMIPRAIPEAKWLIGQLSDDEARQIAEHALGLDTATEIEANMKEILAKYRSSI